MKRKLFYILSIVVLSGMMLNACSDDDPASAPDEPGDPPDLPAVLNPVTIDLGYFTDHQVPDEEEHSIFNSLRVMVESAGSILNTGGGTMVQVSAFLGLAEFFGEEPEYSNGTWTWTFEVPADLIDDLAVEGTAEKNVTNDISVQREGFQGFQQSTTDAFSSANEEDVTIQIQASETSDGIEWVVNFTGILYGHDVENFPFISGFVSSDDSTGEWNFYDPEAGTTAPIITYTWTISSETVYESNATIVFVDGEIYNMDYERDGDENYFTVTLNGMTESFFWNTSTDSGYYINMEGEQFCYSDFVNTEC